MTSDPQRSPDQPENPDGQQPPPPPPPGYGGDQGGQYGGQYGQPYPQQGYGYPQQGYGYGAPATGAYASWGDRVVATLWDVVYLWPAYVLIFVGFVFLSIGGGISANNGGGFGALLLILGILVLIAGYVFAIWRYIKNYMVDQGRTGYTWGKRKAGIRLVSEPTGQPAGIGSCVGRYFLHAIINYAFFIDYLWPLWDPKKQTLTDKVLTTVVVKQPAA